MSFPFYKISAAAAIAVQPSNSAHTGLWHSRFYDAFNADWSVDEEGKRGWIDRTVRLGICGDAEQLTSLLNRQNKLCLALGGSTADLETTAPLVTGMGLSHPVENGFTFHPTLGTPYLPASGIKGVLRAWVEEWMDHDESTKNTCISRWFGAASGNDQNQTEGAGNLIFFDALPTKPVYLACDVMTPHMGKWYEKGGSLSAGDYASAAPADWHSPVPVPFLVAQSGTTFRFMIAPRLRGNTAADAQTQADVLAAIQELKNALEWIGAGAKTATGYGRLIDRVAEQAQQNAANLAAAGIQVGESLWEKSKLEWNKGKQTLTVTNESVGDKHKSVSQSGEQGKKLYAGLSDGARARLDKGKAVSASARIKVQGNSLSLLSIEETS